MSGGRVALLGLDIGTSSCKLTCYGSDGERIAAAGSDYNVSRPQPGWAELDAGDIVDAVRDVLASVRNDLKEFDEIAMAISAQGEAFVLVDDQGCALAPVPISIDRRGLDAIEAFRANPATLRAAEAAGQRLGPVTSLAKLLWFRSADSGTLARTRKVLCLGEFIMLQAGLSPAIDGSMAALTGLLDVHTRAWSPELLELAQLPPHHFPPVARAGQYVGTSPPVRMAKLGLERPVSFYVGGHDQACAALGAGVTNASTALYSMGTTEAIAVPSSDYVGNLADLNIAPYPHVVGSGFIIVFGSQHGGRVLPWLAALLGEEVASIVPATLPNAPSPLILVPHLGGSGSVLADEHATASIHGLDYDTGTDDVVLAALEGITMEQAIGLDRLAGRGIAPQVLRGAGGGAKSDVSMQLKADITGLPIEGLAEPEAACAGAAILAGMGAGVFSSARDGVDRMVTVRRRFAPRPELTEIYASKRSLYEGAYRAMRSIRQLETGYRQAAARLGEKTRGAR